MTIHLTERGHGLRDVLDEEMRQLSERALATLDDKERADFARFLDQLRTNLTTPDPEA